MFSKRRIILYLSVVVLALIGTIYQLLLPGLSIARKEPWELEVQVATWLLHASVPTSAKRVANPLSTAADSPSVAAGRDLFRQKCEVCHAYDGGGKTEIGSGAFPRPPALRAVITSMSDGEIFYHVRNGIRNTAMPAWNMPDNQLWQIVSYLRNLPAVASLTGEPVAEDQTETVSSATYVGSAACKSCHEAIYERWSKSKMANVVRDPKEHPDAIIPDFSKPDPLLTFTKDDVAFVYGSGWKQRYFKKVGDDYFPFPAQWDVTHKMWRPYHVADNTDWWATLYPDSGDNSKRPTGPLCDGC